ncbi:MAG: peptidoglycan-binding domain-containing protein [Solirubrobacteraceae bacterium]
MAEPTLKRGSEGQDVRDLQDALIELDFKPGAADGVFGVYTESAVKAFQKWTSTTADGIVGPETQEKLEQARASYRA